MWWIWEVGWLREREREKRERELDKEGGGERETFAQLAYLVTPVPAPACMSAYLLICEFVSECTSHFDLSSSSSSRGHRYAWISLSLSCFFKLAENKSWTPLQDQTWRSTVLWIKTVIWFWGLSASFNAVSVRRMIAGRTNTRQRNGQEVCLISSLFNFDIESWPFVNMQYHSAPIVH